MILEKKRDQVFLFISSYSYAKFPVLYVSRQKLLSSIGTFPASCLYDQSSYHPFWPLIGS
jgi:hypothetical protein